jgi:hypothetical protein
MPGSTTGGDGPSSGGRRRRYHLGIVAGPSADPVEETSVTSEGTDPGAPLSRLRGAGVAVDGRRVGRVILILCVAAVGIVAIVLFVAGANKNAQINELRTDGVAVKITVTECMGLLGGSGSNGAGYACTGTYLFHGHRFTEAIPGDVHLAPRSTVAAVISPSDPALVSTAAAVRTERSSWRVFIAPAVLAILDLGAIGAALARRRRAPRRRVDGLVPTAG